MMPTLLPTSRSVKPNTLSIMMILPPSVLFTLPTAPEHLLVQNDSLDTLIILEVYCSDKPIHHLYMIRLAHCFARSPHTSTNSG